MAPCSAGWMEEDGKSYALPPPPPPTPCFPVGRRREEEEKFQTSAVVTPLSGIFLLTVRFQKDSPFAPQTAEISRAVEEKKKVFFNLSPSRDERQSWPRVLLTWKRERVKNAFQFIVQDVEEISGAEKCTIGRRHQNP